MAIANLSRWPVLTDKPPASPVEQQMTKATTVITNLLRCVIFLLKNGVYITGFDGRRGTRGNIVTVHVLGAEYLPRIFGDECLWTRRRQVGSAAVYTWRAERYGCRIEWETTTCA